MHDIVGVRLNECMYSTWNIVEEHTKVGIRNITMMKNACKSLILHFTIPEQLAHTTRSTKITKRSVNIPALCNLSLF